MIPENMRDPAHYAQVRLPAEKARPLPNWCYTSEAFFQLEIEHIFMKVWNYAGHDSQIPDPGDYFCLDVTGVPVIIIRGADNEVRAFYNACRHRGSRIASGEGHCQKLVCPYHRWTYETDGRLTGTPLIEEDSHLQHTDLGLLPVRMERWHGFLFINFDENAAPLTDWLGDLPQTCASYSPGDLVCTRRMVWDVNANWKLHFENFNDSLHIPFVHGGTLARQKVSARKRTSHEEFNGECIVHFTSHDGSRALMHGDSGFPNIESLEGRYQTGTWYPCILPTTMMAWTIDSLFVFELHPKGPASMQVVGASFFPKD